MIVRKTRALLRPTIEVLKPSVEGRTMPENPSVHGISISGLGRVRDALESISKVRVLSERAKELLAHPLMAARVEDTVIATQEVGNSLLSPLANLKADVTLICELLGDLAPPEPAEMIHIRLAEVTHLGELHSAVRLLEEVFDQPARRVLGTGPAVIGSSHGSVVIELLAGMPVAAKEMAGYVAGIWVFTNLILVESKRFLSDSIKQQLAIDTLRSVGAEPPPVEQMRERSKEQLRERVHQRLASAFQDVSQENLREASNLLASRLPDLAEEMRKGLRLYASAEASPEVKRLFPSDSELERLIAGDSEIQRLLSSTTDDTGDPND